MTLNEYQQQAMTTCMDSSMNDTCMLFGLVAEVGEIADKVAKWKRKGLAHIDHDRIVYDHVYLDEAREKDLLAEVGDVLWFVAGIATSMGVSLEEIADANLAKLQSRQQRGVIDGNGDNR